jgi:hypothetical protein
MSERSDEHDTRECAKPHSRLAGWIARWAECGRIRRREQALELLADPRIRAEIDAARARGLTGSPPTTRAGAGGDSPRFVNS